MSNTGNDKTFLSEGTFSTGVNYLASNSGTSMWKLWDEEVVRRDLEVLADYGMKILRVMPIWPDFQPITLLRSASHKCGRPQEMRLHGKRLPDTELGQAGISSVMMDRFEKFIEICREFGFELIVPLLTGHVTFELLVPPALEGLDVFTDPISLKWQKKFIRGFVRHFKSFPEIRAWETGNESNCMSIADSAEVAWNWSAMVSDTIRLADNTRPVISGMHSLAIRETENAKWLIADQAEHFDFLTPHPYPCWKPWASCEPCNTIRNVFHAVTEKHFYGDIGGRPSFVEEIGSWRPVFSNLDTHADTVRNIMWNVWAHDGRSMLWWCAFNQENLDVVPYEWEEPGLEHGLFDADRKPLPGAEEYKKFSEMLSSLPFEKLPVAKREAVCLLGGYGEHLQLAHATMILAQQAGINIEFQSSRQPLKDSSLYIMPSAYGRGGLSVEGWKELREKIKSGATLYLSLNNTYLDRIAEVFSAEVKTKTSEAREHTFSFDLDENFELKFAPADFNSMVNHGAEIRGMIDGESPVFFEASYGKGKVYLLGVALEKWMIEHPGAFTNPKTADAWKLYRYVGRAACAERILRKSSAQVTITEHSLTDAQTVAVLVNNSPEMMSEKISVKQGWEIDSVYPATVEVDGSGDTVTVDIERNGGCVLVLRKTE